MLVVCLKLNVTNPDASIDAPEMNAEAADAVGPTNLPAAFFTFADWIPFAARVASVTNETSV